MVGKLGAIGARRLSFCSSSVVVPARISWSMLLTMFAPPTLKGSEPAVITVRPLFCESFVVTVSS